MYIGCFSSFLKIAIWKRKKKGIGPNNNHDIEILLHLENTQLLK
jgi:hypothetical protein